MKKRLQMLLGVCAIAVLMTACGSVVEKADPTPTEKETSAQTKAPEEPMANATSTPEAEPTSVPTSQPTATSTPTPQPTATSVPVKEESYEKGKITETGFESKWLNLRFTTPNGAFLLSQEELDQVMAQGAELLYGDEAQQQLDYAALTTVTEMMVQNADGSNVIVQVEKLPVLYLAMTEEEYISALVTNLKNSNAAVEVLTDENVYSLETGGESYKGITTAVDYGEGTIVYQDYIVRKKAGRMISLVFSYTDISMKNVMALAECFSSYDGKPAVFPVQSALQMGQYKGLELVSVSQAEVDAEIATMLEAYTELVEVNRAAREGDTVNIDYVGEKDGVAFEGGTAEGVDLELGSNAYIDGFEDGLIGAYTGEIRELYLTFPEEYSYPELAGQNVVFTVTVNAVLEQVVPAFTDAFVATYYPDYGTVAGYTAALREALNYNSYYDQITEFLMASCEVKQYDEEAVEARRQSLLEEYTSYAEYYSSLYGMDTEMAIQYLLGFSSKEAMEEEVRQYAYDIEKNSMIIEEISRLENIELTDAVFASKAEEYAISYGYEDVQSFMNDYGEEVVREAMLAELVMTFLVENAVLINAD
ncbi:MAG: FKBP-type peptidyl-prolyl cis-trans isomerase [Lachnospiraceae bacterium]|nr:FKBP-type peptidyl-prolyl cis-trans isomerase [Lachnospiraceae bacterium]